MPGRLGHVLGRRWVRGRDEGAEVGELPKVTSVRPVAGAPVSVRSSTPGWAAAGLPLVGGGAAGGSAAAPPVLPPAGVPTPPDARLAS